MVYNLLGFTQILVRSCKVGTRLRDLLSGLAIAVVIHSVDHSLDLFTRLISVDCPKM